jgi:hypothetical protein
MRGSIALVLLFSACGQVKDNPDADDSSPDSTQAMPDACNDADGDTVCDGADACPGFDDRYNADGDEIPNDCDPCPSDPAVGCAPVTCTVRFDEYWTAMGEGLDPEVPYGPLGIHFTNGAGFGIIGGEGNGDLGNWNLEGTNGSAVWGLWPMNHAMSWAADVTNVRLDFCRGHEDYSQVVTALRDGAPVDSQSVTLVGAYANQTMTFAGPIDALSWTHTAYYGIDNIRFDTTTTSGIQCPP